MTTTAVPPVDPWPDAPLVVIDRFEPARRALARPRGIPMTDPRTAYPVSHAPITPRKRRRVWPWVLLIVGLVMLCGGVLSAVAIGTAAQPTPGAVTLAPVDGQPEVTPAPFGTPDSWRLKASDLRVSVKTRDKDCFGSAGCSVQYRIEAAITDEARLKLSQGDLPYDITYEVSGLEGGTQIGTLELSPDGTFLQDEYQGGLMPSSKTKLRVKVTEVEPS